jgi:7-cyano-7-deazaguanine synthase in queuosine biosynthesis
MASTVRPHVAPHRNLFLLSLALSYGSVVDAQAVALSRIRDDGEWYATASQQFITDMRQVTRTLRAPEIPDAARPSAQQGCTKLPTFYRHGRGRDTYPLG